MLRRPISAGVAAAVAAALVLLLGPGPAAHADTRSVADEKDDVASPNDVLRTKVVNGRRIGVRITHDDLRRSALDIQFTVQDGSGGGNWIVYASFAGDSLLFRTVDGETQTRECAGLEAGRSLRRDVSWLSVPRRCVRPVEGEVRLKPRVQWSSDGTKGDWSVNGNRHWTPYVPR